MTRANGCTIEEFAETTGIPASFLKKVGVTEVNRRRHQAVRLSNAVTYLAPPQDGTAEGDAVERRGHSSRALRPRLARPHRRNRLGLPRR